MPAIVCPKCGRLTERNAPKCGRCGAALGRAYGLESWVRARFGRVEVTRVLLFAIVVIYLFHAGLSAVASEPDEVGRGGLQDFFHQDANVLFALGTQNTFAIRQNGEWWRLVTSVFTHLGIIHLLFNGLALFYVGFMVEAVYGSARALLLFFIAGLSGSLVSLALGINGAGASGALFGYIGALAWYGWRRGGTIGLEIRQKMLFWAAYGMIFGFLVGANNWAHGAGFVGGVLGAAAVGWEPRRLARSRNLLAGLCGLLFVLSWVLTVVHYRENLELFAAIKRLIDGN